MITCGLSRPGAGRIRGSRPGSTLKCSLPLPAKNRSVQPGSRAPAARVPLAPCLPHFRARASGRVRRARADGLRQCVVLAALDQPWTFRPQRLASPRRRWRTRSTAASSPAGTCPSSATTAPRTARRRSSSELDGVCLTVVPDLASPGDGSPIAAGRVAAGFGDRAASGRSMRTPRSAARCAASSVTTLRECTRIGRPDAAASSMSLQVTNRRRGGSARSSASRCSVAPIDAFQC